ncbi:MAG: circadian clock KaiB family protein [Candidatus Freyarchaeum deiterrae]
MTVGKYKIVLYMSQRTPKYHQVLTNIKKSLKNLNLNLEIEQVDLQKSPERALRDGVLITPTLDLVGLNWRFIGVPTVDELSEVLEDLKKREEEEA